MRAKAILVCTFLLISTLGAGAATYKTLYSFDTSDGGVAPFAGLIFDSAGNLYGVAAWGQDIDQGTVFTLTPSQNGWQYDVLHEFYMYEAEGRNPVGGLVMDEAGNLYGTASINDDYDNGTSCGTVFKLSHGTYWSFSVLHEFFEESGCDPESTLTYSNGVLWGTTRSGGSAGHGTVFSLDTSGDSFQFLSFTGKKGTDPLSAFNPWAYGTTFSGGAKGQGNIYQLDPVKGFINKHSFKADGKAGYSPMGDLLTLSVGGVRTIYGTTSAGGVGGGGAVYRLTEIQPNSDKWRFSVLHSFSSSDGKGWAPMAGVTADAAGNLYGTTNRGGEGGWDCGTVFKLSPGKKNKWTHTVLYSFDESQSEGCHPIGPVVFDKAGNLYGTTLEGGDQWVGTVYEVTP